MGIFSMLSKVFISASEQPSTENGYENNEPAFPAEVSAWYMPKFNGRDICDWVDEVAALKRKGDLEQALGIAQGCMAAMVQAAEDNSENVMEFYVSQVVSIQHKMKDYRGELSTLEGWLSKGLPASRQDHRLDLEKRRAKARELVAKDEGRNAAEYTAEWKRLVALEKQAKASTKSAAPFTGRSTIQPGLSYNQKSRKATHKSSWVVPPEVLACPSFVAVDFETANRQGGVSACQIALVKVHQGQVIDRLATLIKPPSGFDSFEFTYLHGISADDVRNSPSWPEIAPAVHAFVQGMPVYAHNAQFDSRVWRELDSFFGTETKPPEFYCSYRTSQHLVPGLENYKLPTVTHALVPWYELDHHEAGSDAEACALIIAALQNSYC